MPRSARIVAVGFPHHVVHRGNRRAQVFFDKEDRAHYLNLLKKYAGKWDAPISAYCLMTNHVHLLTRPNQEESLFKFTQGVALCYSQYFNLKYRLTGRLWESRYSSFIVGEEAYLWAVVRYIEQNPRRARLVKRAEDYPYSSAKAHLQGQWDDVLGEEIFDERQGRQYAAFFQAGATKSDTELIRTYIRREEPFGSEEFRRKMEEMLGLCFSRNPRGWPGHRVKL